MFFEMRFDLGTLDPGERSLPFGLLVFINWLECPKAMTNYPFSSIKGYELNAQR